MAGAGWLACLVVAAVVSGAASYVVGGALFPHGSLIVDPRNFNGSGILENSTDSAYALHYAALEAGRFILELEVESIVLISPHALAHSRDFLLYDNPYAAGSVDIDTVSSGGPLADGDGGRAGAPRLRCSFPPCAFNASVQLDLHLVARLAAALPAAGVSASTLSGFGPPGAAQQPLPLGWAEVIPLLFIQQAYAQAGGAGSGGQPAGTRREASSGAAGGPAQDGAQAGSQQQQQQRRRRGLRSAARRSAAAAAARGGAMDRGGAAASDGPAAAQPPLALILSVPSRRYEHSVSMVPELLSLGRELFAVLDALDERIAIVVSGDLAHTWDAAGPYGYSEAAGRFDAAAQQWARELDRGALLKGGAKAVGEAKSCGFPGMVVLQGVMDGVKPDDMHSVLLEYGRPSYYGMMCAVFDFQGDA